MLKMRKTAVIIPIVIILAACKSIPEPAADPAGVTYTSEAAASTSATETASSETEVPVPPPELYSRSVYMYDMNNDALIYKLNENEKLPPASILKIMTCLLVLENVSELDKKVEVPQKAFDEFTNGDPNTDNAADAGIQPGQTNLTYLDALYALMVASGCEAGNILAYNVSSETGKPFIDMMNAEARRLGCVNTNFTNAHGLYEPDNLTSAYDMFLITKYALENFPLFAKICAETSYIMPPNEKYPPGYKIGTANKLLRDKDDNPHYYPYATGIKSGSINEYFDPDGTRRDGFNTLVTVAEKDGAKFMVVTLGAPFYDYSGGERKRAFLNYDDHIALYEWAFASQGVPGY